MNMTIEQAVQILDQAASRALLPREDHYRVQMAVETIKSEVEIMRKELEELKLPSTNEETNKRIKE